MKKVIPLIDSAKRSIHILVFDWRWYEDQIGSSVQRFNSAIVRAHQRGVDVRATVYKGNAFSALQSVRIKARKLESSYILHVKMIIIDRDIVIMGSHNFTKNAFDLNYEASAIIHDSVIAERFFIEFNDFFV